VARVREKIPGTYLLQDTIPPGPESDVPSRL